MIPFSGRRAIEIALEEDLGLGDVTSSSVVLPTSQSRMAIVTREPVRICGSMIAAHVFWRVDQELSIEIKVRDGEDASAGERIIYITGDSQAILSAERTALNFLQHLSGIATTTRNYVDKVESHSTIICETRKTTPGLRELEKYAVRCGGGNNHRASLADCVMIKENHIAIAGSITAAVERARVQAPHTTRIEVETETLAQVREAITVSADVIMLDNMSPEMVREAANIVRKRAIIEVSGGVTLDSIASYATAGADVISASALTKPLTNPDIGLDFLDNK